MFIISHSWTEDEYTYIERFLSHARALLFTKDFQIEPTEKNKRFSKKYPMKSDEQVRILKSLQVEDCVDFGPNDNPRYPDSTVFKFIKDIEINSFGEIETVCVYIKEYIIDKGCYEIICVISLHEEGMYE